MAAEIGPKHWNIVMKRIYVSLLSALVIGLSAPALAGDGKSQHETLETYAEKTGEYEAKASTLEVLQGSLTPTKQWVAAELINVYDQLSDLSHEIADAMVNDDADREALLGQSYYELIVEEDELWENLEGKLQ